MKYTPPAWKPKEQVKQERLEAKGWDSLSREERKEAVKRWKKALREQVSPRPSGEGSPVAEPAETGQGPTEASRPGP